MRNLAFAVLSLGVVVSAIPNPLITDPPFVAGQCSFHLTETQTCELDSSNLYADITLTDAAYNVIGDTPFTVGINAGSPYTFYSNLPNPIVVTGEHENDNIQFTYGGLSWASTTGPSPNGGAYCNVGYWDPRNGPVCGEPIGDQDALRNMDCSFPC